MAQPEPADPFSLTGFPGWDSCPELLGRWDKDWPGPCPHLSGPVSPQHQGVSGGSTQPPGQTASSSGGGVWRDKVLVPQWLRACVNQVSSILFLSQWVPFRDKNQETEPGTDIKGRVYRTSVCACGSSHPKGQPLKCWRPRGLTGIPPDRLPRPQGVPDHASPLLAA